MKRVYNVTWPQGCEGQPVATHDGEFKENDDIDVIVHINEEMDEVTFWDTLTKGINCATSLHGKLVGPTVRSNVVKISVIDSGKNKKHCLKFAKDGGDSE